MACRINDECIAEGEPICSVDAGRCTDCAACEAVCPAASCVPA